MCVKQSCRHSYGRTGGILGRAFRRRAKSGFDGTAAPVAARERGAVQEIYLAAMELSLSRVDYLQVSPIGGGCVCPSIGPPPV